MALDLTDKTGNGNTLTNVGGTEVTTALPFAQKSKAVDLELSESDHLSAADSVSLSIAGDFTIEAWVKFESLPSGGAQAHFVSKNDGSAESYRFFYTSDAPAGLRIITSNDGAYPGAAGDVQVAWVPSLATWYHVAVTYSDSADEARFYVDGSQQGTTQTVTEGVVFNNAKKLAVGATDIDSTPSAFLDGIITEIRVWNIVRTGTEINNNKAIELTGTETGLVAYWPLETELGSSGVARTTVGFAKSRRPRIARWPRVRMGKLERWQDIP